MTNSVRKAIAIFLALLLPRAVYSQQAFSIANGAAVGGSVVVSPGSSQTIQPNTDVTGLIVKQFNGTNIADTFSVQDKSANKALKIDASNNTVLRGPSPWIDVKAYGASGNAQSQTTGAMTSSSGVLTTSGSPTFVAADVGKKIVVQGAGAAGAVLSTTIATFTNANSVTLTATASTSVSATNLSWGTDDATAITSALAACPASGGSIFFPAGTYYIGSSISAVAKCGLIGFANQATLQKEFTSNALVLLNVAGFYVGGLTFDCNGVLLAAGGNCLASTTGGSNVVVESNVITNTYGSAVYMSGATTFQIRNNRMSSIGNGGVFGENNTSNVQVLGNRIDITNSRNTNGTGVIFHGTTAGQKVSNILIANNQIFGPNTNAFCIEVGQFSGNPATNINSIGNQCIGQTTASFGGISYGEVDGGAITGNTVDSGGQTMNIGIEIVGSQNISAVGNYIRGQGTLHKGFSIDRPQYTTVSGNTVVGWTLTDGFSAIHIGDTSTSGGYAQNLTGNVITGNTLVYATGSATGIVRGIWLQCTITTQSCNFNQISNNNIQGGGQAAERGIQFDNTSALSFDGNVANDNVLASLGEGIRRGSTGTNTIMRNNLFTSVTTPYSGAAGSTELLQDMKTGITFASLPASGNGSQVFCSDCNSTCTAGSSTGRTCFRENGAWTH